MFRAVILVAVAGCYFSRPVADRADRAVVTARGPARALDVGPAIRLSAPPRTWGGAYPSAARDGDDVLVVWLHSRTPQDACMFAQRLSRAGSRPLEVDCSTVNGAPVIAVGGELPLVVWSEPSGIVGATLGARGGMRAFAESPSAGTYKIAVGWDGARYLVAWSDQRDVYLLHASPRGAPLGPAQRLASNGYPPSAFLRSLRFWCTPPSCTLLQSSSGANGARDHYQLEIRDGVASAWAKITAPAQVVLPRFTDKPYFADDRPALDEVVGAETAEGALVTWSRDRTLRVAYVPANAEHVRLPPLDLQREHDPVVVALNDTKFVLVTVTGDRYVEARTITVAPELIAKIPSKRPPPATGVVLDPAGKPAPDAVVEYMLELAGGGQSRSGVRSHGTGAFELRHPYATDHQRKWDVTGVAAWAHRGAEISRIERGTKLTLRLQPAAQLTCVIRSPVPIDVAIDVRVYSPDSHASYRNAFWTRQLTTRGTVDLGDVPAGRVEVKATAANGASASAGATLAPGKRTTLTLDLPAPARPLDLAR